MPQLSRLVLKGYKSIKNLEIDLKPLNVFIGPNGAGKSNFISFFKLLNAIVNQQLGVFVPKNGFADSFLHYGRQSTEAIFAQLQFGADGYQFTLEPTANNRFIFTDETLTYQKEGKVKSVKSLGAGHDESNIEQWSKNNRIAKHVMPIIKSWQVYHFHDTSLTAKVKQIGSIHDHAYLRANASNLGAFLYKLKLKHKRQYQAICMTVQKVAPFFGDFVLEPTLEDSSSIELKWREKRGDFPFTAHHLSDGTLRLIALATVLLQPEPPASIIIDEPELGLHPFAINILGGLIRSLSKSNQIILSTQSVTMLDQFQPNDVIVTEKINDLSKFKRLKDEDLEKWLEEYSLSELWEKKAGVQTLVWQD
jgi:predicted ATPase